MTPRERAEAEARALFVIEQHKDLGDVWWTVSRESTLVASAMSDAGAAARRDEHAAPIADAIERAILAALAERDAGEAERVREAVAREREACAVLCETWTDVYPGASYARGCAARIRARATSPAPEPHPAGRAATDAAKAARARGEDADGEGRCEVAPEPVAADRAVIEAAQFGASWYAYDPETGYDTFETAEEAQRAAEASLDHYRDGSPDGWHESVGEIEWGLLVPYGEARQCDVVNAEDDPTVAANGWDYRCDYRLHSVRSAAVDALAAARKDGAT